MATGYALHIGLNSVLADAYGGWRGPLISCEADAADMGRLSEANGFAHRRFLLTDEATRDAALAHIREVRAAVRPDDIFLLTFSGHGSQLKDLNHDEHEGWDQTWCLYDGQLVDDELYSEWAEFPSDVRILVLSDSCHSGDVIKSFRSGLTSMLERPKVLPPELAFRAYQARKTLYDEILQKPRIHEGDIPPYVLLLSACERWQKALDGPFNGVFTSALLETWGRGAFRGTYKEFHRQIKRRLANYVQQPALTTLGNGRAFASQQPFQV